MTPRIQETPIPFLQDHGVAAVLLALAVFWVSFPGARTLAGEGAGPGERIFRERCARCHGKSGEGVQGGEYPRPLVGHKSVFQLARYIGESMPADAPGTCAPEDALEVARYVHEAFYSPIAQARNHPPRIELSRLTARQYSNVVADLVGSFRAPASHGTERGLRGEYFNSARPGRNPVVERIDPEVRFDFGRSTPAPEKLDPRGFTARWEGSVMAPETGPYEFVVRTDHAARFWINDPERALIDAWVKSGQDTEHRASIYLLGGRSYPIKLEFTSRKQGVQDKDKDKDKDKPAPVAAFIELHWKRPKSVQEVIPARHLSPERPPEVFVLATPFPPDDRSTGYERGTSISKAWADATTEAAIETGGYVVDHLEELAGVRKTDSERETKVRGFCRRLVERAFRRPLDDGQRQLYIDRQFAEASSPEMAVKRAVVLALKSPRFLYLDLHGREPDLHDVASRLSFALWDSLPDKHLLEAADAGQLSSREELARQAERMLQDPRTRSKAGQFLLDWLEVEHVPDLGKDAERFPGFDAGLAADLRTSLELFLEDVVWGEAPDFRRLILSDELYLNGLLAQYYGFDLPAGAPFQKVSTEHPRRAGIVSHPYLMARFAYTDNSSPIHRGVFLIRSVLGRPLRPPPEAFAPLAPDLHPDLTTRERVALQTQPKACQGCHGLINPLGFALEHFDAAGRYRREEKSKPIDTSGSYELPSGETKTFEDARDLAEFLAGSDETHRAFVSQLFHHMVKQPVLAHGVDRQAELVASFTAQGFDIRKLMVEIAVTSAMTGLDAATLALPRAADPPGRTEDSPISRRPGRRVRI